MQADCSQPQPGLVSWSQGWRWSSLLKPSTKQALRSGRRACLKIDTSMSVLFAVRQLAEAALPLPVWNPQPSGREEGEPCFASPEKKGTWWLGEKVYSSSTVTNKELFERQPQQRQLAYHTPLLGTASQQVQQKTQPETAADTDTLGSAGNAGCEQDE